ncbi:TPA: excinuclease ABC subunit C [Candidatus Galligastranaerophilus intestinavium]|uniref:UvrABC system protein C n=1 Tax=Candidatus Galligastranaerophilus intestinavium TaxID=2840836 RepID=A0A9D1FHI0_9BACT|nr:excinuclease ABC subunit C [Candidatus Galligastranaerophilus intestinavium]
MNTDIKKQIKLMPKLPGCYQYFDKNGEIIYIGKAKNLYNRVNSYFVGDKKDSPKLQVMVPQIVKVECIVVNTEVEALILESELIKKYKPKYNILLKDDKKFPYFLITDEEYPRITVVRKANKNMQKGKYFGPYTDSRAMYCTLETLGKIFPLKKCKTPKFKSRPCLYYDIGQCSAPCQKLITSEDYKKILKDVELFLSGRQGELLKALENEMKKASDNLEFEKAARYRDSYNDIKKTMEKQKVVSENTRINQDFVGIVKSDSLYCATILQVRQGRLINKKDFTFSHLANSQVNDINEIAQAVLREYYGIITDTEIPSKITLGTKLDDIELYEKWLSARLGKTVSINEAKSQRDKEMLTMAQNTAEFNLEQAKLKELTIIQNDYNEVGTYLMEKLNLKKFPHTIECYDISHIQGTNTVASGVYFENGMPKKSKYRKYKLRTLEKGEVDDFKSMREILKRRFKRIKSGEIQPPDLIIIDGGKGQLSSVIEVMKEMGLNLDIVSLAKREEEVFLPNKTQPVIFALNSPALHLFQRIRDEAHRFAITFHRQLRSKNMTK